MSVFDYKDGVLFAENIDVKNLASKYKTPLYVYSQSQIENNFLEFKNSFSKNDNLVCYAVKANSNLAILNTIASLGGGFDVVSIGELKRVIASGGESKKCVFSGVGKTSEEIIFALNQDIYCFNVESESELYLIAKIAKDLKKVAKISIRVNPNVDAKTHPAISTGLAENKFGIDILKVAPLYEFANDNENLEVQGVDCHIGSQITDIQPFLDAFDKVLELVNQLKSKNINISHLDLGGGVGINYDNNPTINICDYIQKIEEKTDLKIILEPGRAIVGNAGIFITKVLFTKQNEAKNFAIIDGAMNDLLRPSLYGAYHNILPVVASNDAKLSWEIVGPVCETGDYLGKNRNLNIKEGDLLAVMDSGAYGFTMASNYNTRVNPVEVLVKNTSEKIIRPRQIVEDLFKSEISKSL
jgi:diaminopimelate decarboxylase